jgi:hypothetical protein
VATQEELVAVLRFRDEFTNQANRANGALTTMNRTVGTLTRAVTGFGSGLAKLGLQFMAIRGLMATVGTVVAPFERAFQRLDALGDRAARLGVDPNKLRAISFAFDELDVEVDDLNQGLRFLQRNIGQALADPVGKSAQAFAAINLSVKDANGNVKDVLQVLLELANRMQALPSDAERAATAMELLGRSGDTLLNALGKGATTIALEANRGRELLGTLTDQQIADISALDTALKTLRATWRNLTEQVVLILGGKDGREFFEQLTRIVKALPGIIREVAAALGELWAELKPMLGMLGPILDKIGGRVGGAISKAMAEVADGDAAGEAAIQNQNAIYALGSGGPAGAKGGFLTKPGEGFEELGGDFYLLAQGATKAKEAVKELTLELRRPSGLAEGFQRFSDMVGDAGNQLADFATNIASGMASAFSNFFFDVMEQKINSLKEAFQSLARFIILAMQQAAAQAAGTAFAGLFAGALGGGGGAAAGGAGGDAGYVPGGSGNFEIPAYGGGGNIGMMAPPGGGSGQPIYVFNFNGVTDQQLISKNAKAIGELGAATVMAKMGTSPRMRGALA